MTSIVTDERQRLIDELTSSIWQQLMQKLGQLDDAWRCIDDAIEIEGKVVRG